MVTQPQRRPQDSTSPVPVNTSTFAIAVWRKGNQHRLDSLAVVAFRANSFDFLHYRLGRVDRFEDYRRSQKERGWQLQFVRMAYSQIGLDRALAEITKDLRDDARHEAARQSPPQLRTSRFISSRKELQ